MLFEHADKQGDLPYCVCTRGVCLILEQFVAARMSKASKATGMNSTNQALRSIEQAWLQGLAFILVWLVAKWVKRQDSVRHSTRRQSHLQSTCVHNTREALDI